jgi:CheY-like chemotaxis protein
VCFAYHWRNMPHRQNHTVMVVDDDADIREVLAGALADEGFTVTTAGNGLEALEALQGTEPPCMILLDLMMPMMDGYQFLDVWRDDPCLHEIPVALITASSHLDRRRLDGVPVFPKPITIAKLLEIVAQRC